VNNTVVYSNNKTGELLFKSTLDGKTTFKKDDGQTDITHQIDEDTTVTRKKT